MTVDVCPSESGSPWDPGDSVDQQPEQVFVFGPREDMSDVVVDLPPVPADEDDNDSLHQQHLSPILVAPASQAAAPGGQFEFVITAPTPPASGTSASGSSSATSRTPNETLGTSATSAGFDTCTTLRTTPNGTLRRAASDRPQYLSPSRVPKRHPRHKTISDVTAEARKVLEQLILRNEADAMHGLASLGAAPTAEPPKPVTPKPIAKTPQQVEMRSHRPATSDDPSAAEFGDDELDGKARLSGIAALGPEVGVGLPGSSSYRGDSVVMPDDDATSHSPVSGPNSTYSFSSRSSSHRNRIHLMTQITDEAQLKRAAAQQQQRKKKKKRKTQRPVSRRRGSTSSSSSSEYEIVDGQLRLRDKKSLFKRAKERLRQSFRRKKEPTGHAFDPYSIDDDEIREAQAQTPKTKDSKRRSFRLSLRPQWSNQKSRIVTDHSPIADQGFLSDVTAGTQNGRCPVHDATYGVYPMENGAASLPQDTPAPPGEKEKSRSIFDSILRTLRRGSDRLRRRHSHKARSYNRKEHTAAPPRSRSADALTTHTTSLRREEDASLVRRHHHNRPTPASGGHRKSVPHDDSTMVTTLRGAGYCRCQSADGGVHVPRPRPPPLPMLTSLGPANDVTGISSEVTAADQCQGQQQDRGDFQNDLHVQQLPSYVPPGGFRMVDTHLPTGSQLATDEPDGLDEVDSKTPQLASDVSVVHTPFSEKSEQEKDELFEKIAAQLAAIADNYNLESPRSLKNADLFFKPPSVTPEKAVPKSASAPLPVPAAHCEPPLRTSLTVPVTTAARGDGEEGGARGGGHTPIEQKIGRILRDKGDRAAAGDLSDFQPVVTELVKNASYSRFQQIIHENVGTEPGWQQVALVFNLTRSAVQLAGLGTAAALQIKELTLRYFEDRFAGWIVGQGGWESMVEDTDLSSEVD